MMIFSNNKYYVCPRDIEIYLSAIFFYLAAALPHHINSPPQDVSSHDTKPTPKKKGERTAIRIPNYSPPPSPPPIAVGLSG